MEHAAEAEAGAVVRRAPFSQNPNVGARGQRTQQRILDAALRAFGEVGYHECSIDGITTLAGCSRVSFYQYFSSKEDVFRHLAALVARQLNAATDLLDPITGDDAGWESVRAWANRYADIRDRYQPVFHVFPAAAESDVMLADDSTRAAHRYLVGIQSRVVAPAVPSRELDTIIDLLRESLGRTLDDLSTLTSVVPRAFPRTDVLDAYTDVVHRTLFGLRPGVNVNGRRRRRPPTIPFGPVMRAASEQDHATRPMELEGRKALRKLLGAAHDVFVERGYHGTRVDDIVEAAGVSHGAFYRYFKNKDELAHLMAAQAMRTVSTTFTAIPDLSGDKAESRAALRRWLRALQPGARAGDGHDPRLGGRRAPGREPQRGFGRGARLGPAPDGSLPRAARLWRSRDRRAGVAVADRHVRRPRAPGRHGQRRAAHHRARLLRSLTTAKAKARVGPAPRGGTCSTVPLQLSGPARPQLRSASWTLTALVSRLCH